MSKPKDSSNMSDLLAYRKKQKGLDANKPKETADEEGVQEITTQTPDQESKEESKKVGRPRGRRSNPENTTLTLIVNENVLLEARYKLNKMNIGKSPKKTLSDLTEELLKEWIGRD